MNQEDTKMSDTKIYLLNSRILYNQKDVAEKALVASNTQILFNKLTIEKAVLEIELLESKVNKLTKLKKDIIDNINIFHPDKHDKINQDFIELNDHSKDSEKLTRIKELETILPILANRVNQLGVEYSKLCDEFEELIAKKPVEVYFMECETFNTYLKEHGEEEIRKMAKDML